MQKLPCSLRREMNKDRKFLVLLLLAGLISTLTGEAVEPYAIYSIPDRGIGKVSIVGPFPNEFSLLLEATSQLRILGIDYHYQKNLLFWTKHDLFDTGEVWQASLSNGSEPTLLIRDIMDPTDLAVDWLNDILYVAGGFGQEVLQYNLVSSMVKSAISTPSSHPTSIVVYPDSNTSWLFWTDTNKGAIERANVNSHEVEVIKTAAARRCFVAIALDVNTSTVYWLDSCSFRLESVIISDRHTISEVFQVRLMAQVPRGMSVFEGYIYLTITRNINHISRYNGTTGVATQISQIILGEIHGIEIVHPDRQPHQEIFLSSAATTPTATTSTTITAPSTAIVSLHASSYIRSSSIPTSVSIHPTSVTEIVDSASSSKNPSVSQNVTPLMSSLSISTATVSSVISTDDEVSYKSSTTLQTSNELATDSELMTERPVIENNQQLTVIMASSVTAVLVLLAILSVAIVILTLIIHRTRKAHRTYTPPGKNGQNCERTHEQYTVT